MLLLPKPMTGATSNIRSPGSVPTSGMFAPQQSFPNLQNPKSPSTSPATTATPSGVIPGTPAQRSTGISGTLGLLRTRDTGNSPSRERMANPMIAATTCTTTAYGGRFSTPSNHATSLRNSVDAVLGGALFSRGNDEHLVPSIPSSLLLVHPPQPPAATETALHQSPQLGGKNVISCSNDSNSSIGGGSTAASSIGSSPVTKVAPSSGLSPKVTNLLGTMPTTVVKPHVTVVFDLDETLCSNRRVGKAILRPGAIELLKTLANLSSDPSVNCYVEVILWTASMECVARPVVERMDPQGTIFAHLIFRDRRWYKEVGYTKDLTKLGRDMGRVVILENSPESVRLNRKNSILVRDFLGANPHDQDLFVCKEVLESWIRQCGSSKCASEQIPIQAFLAQHPQMNDRNEVVTAQRGGTAVGHGRSYFLSAAGSPVVNPRSPLHVPPSRGSVQSRGYGTLRRF